MTDRPPHHRPLSSGCHAVILISIIVFHCGLGLGAARRESVTVDEFAHLPAGISYWRMGDFRLYSLSPPLLRLWAAAPVAWSVKLTNSPGWKSADHWQVGYDFMYANRKRYQDLFNRARMSMSLWGVFLILLVWGWSRNLDGPQAGLAAAFFAGLSPHLLAHAPLVTTDVGAAVTFAAAVYAADRFAARPGAGMAGLVGAALGVALLSKFSALLLVPLLPVMWFLRFRAEHISIRPLRLAGYVLLIAAAALLIVNTGYLWKGSFSPIGDSHLQSNLLQALRFLPAWLPLPLPYDFINGLDLQSLDNQNPVLTYFLGQLRDGEPWYALLVMLAAKVSPALAAGVIIGLAVTFAVRRPDGRDWFILLPPLALLITLSALLDVAVCSRYLLSVFPFLFILAGRGIVALIAKGRLGRLTAAALVVGQLGSAVLAYPYFISYYNFAAGGRASGYRVAVDSNWDWGQDLIRLREYQEENKTGRICLAYFGRVDPVVYRIDSEWPSTKASCSITAISASLLMGTPYYGVHKGQKFWIPARSFEHFQSVPPDDRVGTTIFIYRQGPKAPPGIR